MTTYETPEPISVTIDLGVGDVRIVASGRADTVVDVRPSRISKDSDVEAAEQTRIEFVDGRLLVKTPKSWKQYTPFGRDGRVDVTIELPIGSSLQGETGFGKFDSEGELGACRIKTGYGNIRLDHTGALQASTGYGDIDIEHAAGSADVATGSGEVRIREVEGAASIKNSNGDTRLGGVTGALRVKAANGDISVERSLSAVSAKTANGSVRIGDVVSGAIVVETACGDLEVGIREGTAAWLDASSQYGSVLNSLEASDAPGRPDKTAQIRARTAYGDIVIRRSLDDRMA
ncbi:MAG: DUF4097 family beta strand repeat-containing protein [Aeromicrobium sp.]